jgi:hypothetical protein
LKTTRTLNVEVSLRGFEFQSQVCDKNLQLKAIHPVVLN